jgi:hypothetical protein
VNWIIYTLKHPRTSEVRYVGFTLQTPKQRLGEHISEALRSLGPERRRSHKNNWVLSLLTIGLIPVLEVIEDGAGDGWKDTERHWIAGYQAAGARLVNAKHGGDGVIGYWGTAEQRTAAARRKKKVPLISRVMGRVMVDDSAPVLKGVHCLRFTGALNPNGYAQVSDGNYGRVYVHVVTWVDKHGPVPPGKELHHLCVNRWCCAWQHLETNYAWRSYEAYAERQQAKNEMSARTFVQRREHDNLQERRSEVQDLYGRRTQAKSCPEGGGRGRHCR